MQENNIPHHVVASGRDSVNPWTTSWRITRLC